MLCPLIYLHFFNLGLDKLSKPQSRYGSLQRGVLWNHLDVKVALYWCTALGIDVIKKSL